MMQDPRGSAGIAPGPPALLWGRARTEGEGPAFTHGGPQGRGRGKTGAGGQAGKRVLTMGEYWLT
jgi:hypothetical protein